MDFEQFKTVEDVKAAIERDPLAFIFAVWDAENAEADDDPPPAPASPAPHHCHASCPCHIPFAVGKRVRTNRFLPPATGIVERLGKRMPRHSSGHYVYVRFDDRSPLPPSLADRRRAFFGGFDLVPEGDADPFASQASPMQL
jgi:hypothetical protein